MDIKIPAKINLGLNVVSKRPDGYHNLETVFYPVPLFDKLEISGSNFYPSGKEMDGASLTIEGLDIEGNVNNNLVMKAYRLLEPLIIQRQKQSATSSSSSDSCQSSLNLHLRKNIPTQAGMGGGSADAAYTLLLLDRYFDLGLTQDELLDYALKLGADCPFFILSRPAFATGVGEKLEEIALDLTGYYLGIIKPEISISTREAFSNIVPCQPKVCCKEIVSLPVEKWRDNLKNDFEDSVFSIYPQLAEIKQTMYDAGALYASMTGSGSVIFGIFKEKNIGKAMLGLDYFLPLSKF